MQCLCRMSHDSCSLAKLCIPGMIQLMMCSISVRLAFIVRLRHVCPYGLHAYAMFTFCFSPPVNLYYHTQFDILYTCCFWLGLLMVHGFSPGCADQCVLRECFWI